MDSVSVVVTRGAISMWLFAFVFASSFNLSTGVLNDMAGAWEWLRRQVKALVAVRVLIFLGLFLLVMKSPWAHNWLSAHLGWLTSSTNRELQGFVAFVFAICVALSNSLLTDLRNRTGLRIALRIGVFVILFLVIFRIQVVGHSLERLLGWLRVEHYS